MVVGGLNSLLQETKADMRGHCITELQDQKVASNRKAGFEWDRHALYRFEIRRHHSLEMIQSQLLITES